MKESDFQAKVILFSNPIDVNLRRKSKPLITIQLHYPRMIHAEVMTHRVFSRNARSGRAVPVNKLLQEEIYIPHFMKNQPGMQAFEEFDIDELEEIEKEWERFARETQRFAKWLADKGVHKQWANRPLEWFGYIDTLITATDWDNFFSLRIHKDAMPEIKELAKAMDKEIKRIVSKHEYQNVCRGDWHIPYILKEEEELDLQTKLQLSVARCARVSYAPFDGNASVEKEIVRYDLLKNADPMHASPFEHQARVASVIKNSAIGTSFEVEDYIPSNLAYPWLQYRKLLD